jgi:hypothetical protein
MFGQNVTALQLLGMAIVIAGLLLPRMVKWQQQWMAKKALI